VIVTHNTDFLRIASATGDHPGVIFCDKTAARTPAIFVRGGATTAARTELSAQGGILVDLARLFDDLSLTQS
jgi:hypothetical protein